VKTRSRRGLRRRPKMNSKIMIKLARNAVLKTCETKYVTLAAENINLYHNGGATAAYVIAGNLLGTTQTNTQNGRLGDEVWPRGLAIKLWLSNKDTRPNVMYRVMVVATPPDQVASTSPANLFQAVLGNKMLDYVNTDKYQIKYEKLVQPFSGDYSLESGSTLKEHSKAMKIWIPFKGKLTYALDAGSIPKYQRHCLSLCVIPYDAYGSIATDNIASVAYTARFYFKDP